MDLAAVIDPKQSSKSKKRGDTKHDSFQPLTAEEKANICSHQLDYVLQKIGEVQRKGEDEVSEVCSRGTRQLCVVSTTHSSCGLVLRPCSVSLISVQVHCFQHSHMHR